MAGAANDALLGTLNAFNNRDEWIEGGVVHAAFLCSQQCVGSQLTTEAVFCQPGKSCLRIQHTEARLTVTKSFSNPICTP